MESPDHLEGERSFPFEHLVHAITAADERNEVAGRESLLLHVILDGSDRVG
jgi:hypothetical protein